MLIRDRHLDPDNKSVINYRDVSVNPAINLTNAVVRLFKAHEFARRLLAARVWARTVTGSVKFNFAIAPAEGVLVGTTLAISATAEKFKTITTTCVYLIAGVVKTKAATDNLVFSSAYTVNNALGAGTAHWGAFLVQLDAAGAVSTLAVSADQDYATEALAIASLPAAAAGKTAIGYITVQAKTGGTRWTANTDDMTAASDCTAANFHSTVARTPFTADLTPVAVSSVEAVLDTSATTEYQAEADEYIAVMVTTDGTGALVDGELTIVDRPARVFRGE